MTQDTTCKERIHGHLKGRELDFIRFMNGTDEDYEEFSQYGLGFDFVESSNKTAPYHRFQLSWGGPSDEIRFYDCGVIEYVFMDWGDGAAVEITERDWAKWLKDWFVESGMIKNDSRIEYGE